KAYLYIRKTKDKEIAPFGVSIHSQSGIRPPDSITHPMVRALDESLNADDEEYSPVEVVASTIFPERLWKLFDGDRDGFYREAMRNLRTFTTWAPHKSRWGMYFGRLFGFGVDHKTGKSLGYKVAKALGEAGGNQIEHVIRQLKKSVGQGRTVA